MSDPSVQEKASSDVTRKGTGQTDVEAQGAKQDFQATDFQHGFWDRELAPMRKEFLIGILRVTIAICVLIWAIVTM
jgi:hypothetical protein